MINFNLKRKFELVEKLAQAALAKETSISAVESCTGGGIAYALTSLSGSSAWFGQSWVTYSNDAKHSLIGVDCQTLDEHGAVSEQVVSEMASKGAMLSNAGLCVAVSGIAGPDGGSEEKPVGLVWFGIGGDLQKNVKCFSRRFTGDRGQVREQAIVVALEKLVESLAD